MRLRELFESNIDTKIKDSILVMMSRSKTTGEPYSLSYSQLARMINYPSDITADEIQKVIDNDPTLGALVTDFDEYGLEINAQAATSTPLDAMDPTTALDEPTLPAEQPLAAEPTLPAEQPPLAEPAAQDQEDPVQKLDTVKRMAARAATRRAK